MMPSVMRSLSSCFEATRIWRRTERANLEKKPSMRPLAYRDVAVGIGSIWRFFDREGVPDASRVRRFAARHGPCPSLK